MIGCKPLKYKVYHVKFLDFDNEDPKAVCLFFRCLSHTIDMQDFQYIYDEENKKASIVLSEDEDLNLNDRCDGCGGVCMALPTELPPKIVFLATKELGLASPRMVIRTEKTCDNHD